VIDINGVDESDHIISCIRRTETFYEIELLNYLLVRGPLGGVYIDVGANIGNHSIFFAKFLADHVVCVEPSDKIRQILERNLEANHIINYSLADCALGAAPAQGRLQYPDNNNIGMTKVVQAGPVVEENAELVRICALDGLMEALQPGLRNSRISLVKIDVEGMELDVLQGAHSILAQHKPQLILEAATEYDQDRLFSYLKPFGYEPIAQFCYTPTFHLIIPGAHQLRDVTFLYRAVRWFRSLQHTIT